MSEKEEAKKEEEAKQEERSRGNTAVKISNLLGKAGGDLYSDIRDKIEGQIHNNQELYTTLSRSLLELHNDVRQFRDKLGTLEKGLFGIQHGFNKLVGELSTKIHNVEERLAKLTELWNTAVDKAAEEETDAPNEERLED